MLIKAFISHLFLECSILCGKHAAITLEWRHIGRDSVSNHQPHYYLLNHSSRRRSKKTSKFHGTGLCAGTSPGTSEFPAQRASNAENVFIWWRHHEIPVCQIAPNYKIITPVIITANFSIDYLTFFFINKWNRFVIQHVLYNSNTVFWCVLFVYAIFHDKFMHLFAHIFRVASLTVWLWP